MASHLAGVQALGAIPIVALTLWGEGRGEPVEGRIAIACVVRNRMRADLGGDGQPDWWGEGYDGVCLAPFQFSCWNRRDPNYRKLLVLASQPHAWLDDSVLAENLWIAEGVVGGRLRDRVGQATHYHAAHLTPAPPWTVGAQLVGRVGAHLFYGRVR
jgi:N-acetylmuramoyl-L-alanine amidase